MKKMAVAAALGLTLALSAASSFAAERNNNETSGSGIESQCDNILGSKDAQSPAHIRYCENHQ
jgi:hypothetical protein